MALPIKETPVLTGRDALKFVQAMQRLETEGPTEKDRSDFLRAKNVYDKMKAKGWGELP